MSEADGRAGLYSARPLLRVDGRDDPLVEAQLLSMEMSEGEGGMSALELRFSNRVPEGGSAGPAFDDDRVLRLGAGIAVSAGPAGEAVEIFRGTVTALEGVFSGASAPELRVLAEDALQRARLSRRTALHENVTLAGLVGEVASRAGLEAATTGLPAGARTEVQWNESDLAFLRRLLARHDADLQVAGTRLEAGPRGEIRRGGVELVLYGTLKRARVLADLAHQATETTTAGWDPAAGARISVVSRGANPGPGSGTSGARALEGSLGTRSEHVADLAVATDAEARALAEAAFDRRARRFVTLEGTADGDPGLRVGTHVRVTGLGRFDNTYYVVRARHRWDEERGYETDFEAECAFLGET